MRRKPSEIHKKKIGKMSRRRLMNTLTTFGFSTATAAALQASDVKAADSDQVPISIDHSGDSIVMVDADWYDHLERTRDTFEEIKRAWLPPQGHRHNSRNNKNKDEYDDVLGVFISAGKGNENPHIIVSIDQESDTKDETRGNIPERRDGSRIEVEEMSKEKELAVDHTDCNDKEVSDPSNMLEASESGSPDVMVTES